MINRKGFNMMKIRLVVLSIFISSVYASERYDSDTVNQIQEIYWLNEHQDGAILYARHAGFFKLKSMINDIIMTSPQIENHQFKIEGAEKLLLTLPASKKTLVVYLKDNKLFFAGQTYITDKSTIKEMIKMNAYRLEKGDEIAQHTLTKALPSAISDN